MKTLKEKVQELEFIDLIALLLFGPFALFITTISIGLLVCIIGGDGTQLIKGCKL